MLDHAILSGGVHSLENDQERPAVLCVEFLLQVAEHAFARFKYALRVLFVLDASSVSRVPILQPKLPAFGNAKGLREARGLFDEFVVFHGFGSVVQTCGSEQRAQSPSEGGEAIVGVEEGIL